MLHLRRAASSRPHLDLFDSLLPSSSTHFKYTLSKRGIAHVPARSKNTASPREPPPRTGASATNASKRSPRVRPGARSTTPDATHYLLTPYELSSRILKLHAARKLDEAVELLQNSPLDAQNIKTWNTLLSGCMKDARYKLAWSLFVDLKRRGFVPNVRTYCTMFTGYEQITDWTQYSKQLDNIHSLYEQYNRLAVQLSVEQKMHEDLYTDYVPASYISILGRAGHFQKAFDVFHELESDNSVPLIPTQSVFNRLTGIICMRALEHQKDSQGSILERDISDMKYVWRRLAKRAEPKNNEIIHSRAIDNIVRVLSLGKPSDHELALSIVHDYLGYGAPDEPPLSPKVFLNNPHPLRAILALCTATGRHDLCLTIISQVTKNPRQAFLVSGTVIEEVFKSHIALAEAGSTIQAPMVVELLQWSAKHDVHELGRSRSKAYEVCWKCHDWDSAKRVFRVLTGHSLDFLVADAQSWKVTKSSGKDVQIPALEWAGLLRTALSTHDKESIRQSLRMLDRYGGDIVAFRKPGGRAVASLVVKAVASALRGGDVPDELRERWAEMGRRAAHHLKEMGPGSPDGELDDAALRPQAHQDTT